MLNAFNRSLRLRCKNEVFILYHMENSETYFLIKATVNAWKEKLTKKIIFHWQEKNEDQIMWMMKCCKKSEMF